MGKKLRVAVYINGQWRGSSYKCAEYLKPYFEQFDVDYYIHTCDYYFGKNIKLDFGKNESTYKFSEIDDVFHSKEDIERIKNTYENVVYFQIDDKKKNQEITDLKPNLSAFYNIYGGYKCNQYRKVYENLNGFKYDCIIKIRPDIIFEKNKIDNFEKLVRFVSENPNYFLSEHSIPRLKYIQPNIDYPIDIFQIGKNFFDILDEWVITTLEGSEVYLSNLVLNLDYDIYNLNAYSNLRVYIVRELYKFNNLLDRFYNSTLDYSSSKSGYTVCDLDEILYMGNTTRKEKKSYFKDWDIDFENIIKLSNKEINTNPYLLGDNGLKTLAYEIENKWKQYETRINNL